MQQGDNWFVDAPWAQLLCSTKIPDNMLLRFVEMSDEVLEKTTSARESRLTPRNYTLTEKEAAAHAQFLKKIINKLPIRKYFINLWILIKK